MEAAKARAFALRPKRARSEPRADPWPPGAAQEQNRTRGLAAPGAFDARRSMSRPMVAHAGPAVPNEPVHLPSSRRPNAEIVMHGTPPTPPTPPTPSVSPVPTDTPAAGAANPLPGKRGPGSYIKLARLHQWSKGAFVLVGPAYGAAAGDSVAWGAVGLAFLAFGLASSGCYVVNDIQDREADRHHPRKRRRPIASGAISVRAAWTFAVLLFLGATASAAGMAMFTSGVNAAWAAAAVAAYVVNVLAYTYLFKGVVILDVISLAMGFVLRVLGGCAAAGVEPSTWLLNCTLFVSMFLALGKRLGERRTAALNGGEAASARAVQSIYTDDLLRMAVVVTGVACLVTYAGYVQDQAEAYTRGFNLLWLTMLPATYGLLRCIVLVERGDYDDPTELATKDPAFQAAGALFVAITAALVLVIRTR